MAEAGMCEAMVVATSCGVEERNLENFKAEASP